MTVSFTLFLSGPNILFSDQFSGSRGLCSSLELTDQFSNAYRTTYKIIFLSILRDALLDGNRKTKDSEMNDKKESPQI
jgi:hypothetical protein